MANGDQSRSNVGPIHASVRLGRIGGIEVGVNWSWFIVVGLITWSLADSVFPTSYPGQSTATYWTMAIIGTILFFVCLTAHEFGHAIVAKRDGMEISGITLWVFGGVASFKGMFHSASSEFKIAIAGPIVSLVLGVFFIMVATLTNFPVPVEGIIAWVGWINIFVLIFNMLPALPLDGGRVLRSAIWGATKDFTKSTRIAGAIAKVFGQVMIAGGLLLALLLGDISGLWLTLIGFFLIMAASAETNYAKTQARLSGFSVADAMHTDPTTVADSLSLKEFIEDVFPYTRHSAYPVTKDGQVTGLITFKRLSAVPQHQWEDHHVSDFVVKPPDALVVIDTDDLAKAALALSQNQLGRALVIDGEQHLVGLLSVSDLAHLLSTKPAT
jgi:Zn-dependent protease